jgi:hypothetical protein
VMLCVSLFFYVASWPATVDLNFKKDIKKRIESVYRITISFICERARQAHTNRVCLDGAKNNARIKELRITNEDSKKIMIFRLAR